MKTYTKIIAIVLITAFGCHKFPNHTPIISSNYNCSNQVMAALITPSDLQNIINTPSFSKAYLQFKTTNDHSFYPAAFAGSFPYTDKSSLITPLSLSSPFYPSRPYIFGTLEWEFAAGFTPDMSKQYYCLLPAMDPDGIHVTYTYITIPYSFQYKDSSVSIPDTSFVKNLGQEELDSLTVSALAATISGSTKINPCPPKTP
jgi:hypothetical protein